MIYWLVLCTLYPHSIYLYICTYILWYCWLPLDRKCIASCNAWILLDSCEHMLFHWYISWHAKQRRGKKQITATLRAILSEVVADGSYFCVRYSVTFVRKYIHSYFQRGNKQYGCVDLIAMPTNTMNLYKALRFFGTLTRCSDVEETPCMEEFSLASF